MRLILGAGLIKRISFTVKYDFDPHCDDDMFVGASVKGRYLWPQEPAAAAAAAAAAALRFASPFQLNAGRARACTSALQQTSFICLNSKHHLPVFKRFKQERSRILGNIISPLVQ